MKSQRIDFERAAAERKAGAIGKVLLVGSGKGGVGKSLVSCGLAISLAKMGRNVGLLDLDVHGASVPHYLGLRPPVKSTAKGLEPKVAEGVKAMSLALFTGKNPLPIRGASKQSLINQFFALTDWGKLDYLVVDLPPSTGDEVLSAFQLFGRKASLVLVTTPSKTATEIVSMLALLAEREKVRVHGVVVNMAYSRVGKGRSAVTTYPFGETDERLLGALLGSPVVAQLPLDPRVSSEGLLSVLRSRGEVSKVFEGLASQLSRPKGGGPSSRKRGT